VGSRDVLLWNTVMLFMFEIEFDGDALLSLSKGASRFVSIPDSVFSC